MQVYCVCIFPQLPSTLTHEQGRVLIASIDPRTQAPDPRCAPNNIMEDHRSESWRWRQAFSREESLALRDSGEALECPSARDIFDTVAGCARPSVRREVVAHIARCSACAQLWQCAMRLLLSSGFEQSCSQSDEHSDLSLN